MINWKVFKLGHNRLLSKNYPGILEVLRKTVKNLSQDSRSPGWDINSGPPDYEAGVLTTRLRRPVSVECYRGLIYFEVVKKSQRVRQEIRTLTRRRSIMRVSRWYVRLIRRYCKSSPATLHEGAWGERRYSSYPFTTSALDGGEWSASRPGRTLPPGKGPPVPIVQEAEWAPEPVWTQRLEEKSFRLCRESNLDRLVVYPVARHRTDWATRLAWRYCVFTKCYCAAGTNEITQLRCYEPSWY
jgi:hypothetical protein